MTTSMKQALTGQAAQATLKSCHNIKQYQSAINFSPTQTMELSPLDQIMVRGIVRLVLCFSIENDTERPKIVQMLQNGIDSTVKQMPYLSGSIREKGNQRSEIEVIFKEGEKVELLVKDVGTELPSFTELKEEKMPPSYFKDDLLSPMRNMPESGRKLHPVMAVQANFLRGGLFLCVCFHHSVLDGAGFAYLLGMLAKNCLKAPEPESYNRGEDSLERGGLFKTLEPGINVRKDGFPEYFLDDPSSMVPSESGDEYPTTARMFHVKRSALPELKNLANASDLKGTITTHDALGALIWRCVTRARAGRTSKSQESKLCIFKDCRKRIAGYVPPDFIGNVCVGAQAPLPIHKVLNSDMSVLAEKIHDAVDAVDKNYVLGLIEHVKEYPKDLNCIKPGIHSYMGNDINLVSWIRFPVYEMDFGSYLGKPEWFRCPWRTLDGTVKLLPQRPDADEVGEIEVNVELREDDMERLLRDPLWKSYTHDILY